MKKKFYQIPGMLAIAVLLGIGAARAADPVITDPVSTSIGLIKGGDVGEGLDLEGEFTYALSIGADVDFKAKIRDATFLGLIDAEVPGATFDAGNRILNWYVVDYGDSANDDLLEAATSSIRWSNAADANKPQMILTLENLEPGVQYKVQMMFGEQCCNRGFDILFDDNLILKDFNPGVVHADGKGTLEALVTHLYTPKQKTAVLRFDGRESSTDYSDHNAILNAITFEKVGVALDTDKDGMPDSYEKQYGFDLNDASDAAKDFDKDGATNLEEFKAGTDPVDVTKPVVLSASSTGSLDTVNIAFSEELDPASAITLANYSISPSLSVTSATYKKKVVTLTTAKQTAGGTAYTVTVNGVKDTSKNAVAVDSKVSFFSYLLSKTGALRFAAWTGVAGNAVQGLFDDPRYPVTPDITGAAFSFNSREVLPTDSLEAYGAVLEGFVTPTESGNYDFFLKSDDASQLSISTDEKESNLAVVAEELGCCGPFEEVGAPETTGTPIPLVAGKKYYVRAIYKEGGGGDYVQVAWKKTTDTTKPAALQPIPTQFLSSAVDVSSPAEGAFRTMTPAANAKGVAPSTKVIIVHRDGKTEWTKANVSLKIDGTLVSPTVTKVGATLTLEYSPSALLASGSVHTVDLGYSDPGGKPTTLTWSFTVQTWSGPTRDKVGSYPAIITGASGYTADKGGATGKAGDYGMDLTKKGGAIVSLDATFLTAANAAAGKDEMSVAFWAKKYDIADTSAFVLRSPSSGNQRAFHAHVPWSNGHIYFDTGDPAGCCDGTRNRIEADIATFPDYTGAAGDITWWTTKWHLFAFTKKADSKQIWIDGKLFLEGNNTGVLATDINAFLIGADGDGGGLYHAIVDDFSVYSTKLVEADVLALTKGTLPTALGASKGLIGYWDFNDAGAVVVVPPKLSIGAGAAGKAVLTFEGTLQASDKVSGPFGDAAGASPLTIDAAGAAKFYRAIRK